MTRLEWLRRAGRALCDMGIEDGMQEALHALSCFLSCEISALYLRGDSEVPEEIAGRMEDMIRRRRTGEPLAYILGERYFMGLRFLVGPDVLIPRQETELLAEKAIAWCKAEGRPVRVLDMCTGSGCLAVSVAKLAGAQVTACDISRRALAVAEKNAEENGAEVEFIASDLFAKVEGTFDLIVSNPPYVSREEYAGLMREVREHEPETALLAEENGLAFYRRIAREAGEYLRRGGGLFLEIGAQQGAVVKEILRENGFGDIVILPDYAGRDRMALCRREI